MALAISEHEVGEGRGVAEGIDVVGGGREGAEAGFEIGATEVDLFLQAGERGEVAVGLDVPSADGFPATGGDVVEDAGEEGGRGLLELLVEPGFSAGEGQVGMAIEEVADGGRGVEDLVESGAPRPEPDGIEVGIEDR